jgi:hypothetical protein
MAESQMAALIQTKMHRFPAGMTVILMALKVQLNVRFLVLPFEVQFMC